MTSTNPRVPLHAADAIESRIANAMMGPGFLTLSDSETEILAQTDEECWSAFVAEWNDLKLDRYMADGGTYRLRRYGRASLDTTTGKLVRQSHAPYVQSTSVNRLNGGMKRHFSPCTNSFWDNPVLHGLLPSLGAAFTRVTGQRRWDVKLHPYRILAGTTSVGEPAPEGRHRDGVTYIMTMLIDRHRVTGGSSTVYTNDGDKLAEATLERRGEILMGDDRATMHAVTSIHPAGSFAHGHRDVLVIAFTADSEEL